MTSINLQQLRTPAASRYHAYAYAYPHKTSYRHMDPAIPLKDAWAKESKDSLFLYVHLPFCEMRCGFCNLFTLAQPQEDLVDSYLRTLKIETESAADALGPTKFTQMAIGGGTPTFLDAAQLHQLFEMLVKALAIPFGRIPLSVETSPRTATSEKMLLLKQYGATRVSIGVQSFIESEVAASGRAQSNTQVQAAIQNIRAAQIPILNLDLIYGLPGQTIQTWLTSVRTALTYSPEEIYLYPLYVRPLTGLGRREMADSDIRATCYTEARDLLVTSGYEQVSMRMFRLKRFATDDGPIYCCQDDGMVGLGCGARSYTRELHYSREFAVGRDGVKSILRDYIARDSSAFSQIDYGCRLDAHEQRRRYIIKSILRIDGLSLTEYKARFGTSATHDVPDLIELVAEGFLSEEGDHLRPTQLGLDFSDAIGPRLFSPEMLQAMEQFDLR